MEYIIKTGQTADINIAPATEKEEILQNVRTILGTLKGSIPLDRSFGIDSTIVDLPLPVAQAKLSNEIFQSIKKYEPRANIITIKFIGSVDGRLQAEVKITI